MDYPSSYPTKLPKLSENASKKEKNDWIKSRTLELYSYLPQTTLEERDSYRDIRDEIIILNDSFFWYVARCKVPVSKYVSLEDKYQSAVCNFMANCLWAKFMFSPEIEDKKNRRYRDDLAFTSFFKPRLTECIERELFDVKWSLRRSLCIKAGEQLGKKGTEVVYEDLANVHLPPNEMESLMSIFCTNNTADINDISLYKPASTIVEDRIEEMYNDEYDSIEDLLVHEMIEREQRLEDSFLLKMSDLYGIPFNELVDARPGAEEKLRRQLEEAISVQDAFSFGDEYYAEADE